MLVINRNRWFQCCHKVLENEALTPTCLELRAFGAPFLSQARARGFLLLLPRKFHRVTPIFPRGYADSSTALPRILLRVTPALLHSVCVGPPIESASILDKHPGEGAGIHVGGSTARVEVELACLCSA